MATNFFNGKLTGEAFLGFSAEVRSWVANMNLDVFELELVKIDIRQLESFKQFNSEAPCLVRFLVLNFFSDLSSQLLLLQDYLKIGDVEEAKKLSHKLKSTSANLGFGKLSLFFKNIEEDPNLINNRFEIGGVFFFAIFSQIPRMKFAIYQEVLKIYGPEAIKGFDVN